MGKELADYLATRRAPKHAPLPLLPREERKALHLMRMEARAAGTELKSGGIGGLPPSLVLHVMRRDRFTCKVCGERGVKATNGGITVHHKGGIPESDWLRSKGHKNEAANIVTICDRCHNKIHEEAEAAGIGE